MISPKKKYNQHSRERHFYRKPSLFVFRVLFVSNCHFPLADRRYVPHRSPTGTWDDDQHQLCTCRSESTLTHLCDVPTPFFLLFIFKLCPTDNSPWQGFIPALNCSPRNSLLWLLCLSISAVLFPPSFCCVRVWVPSAGTTPLYEHHRH